jgi:hypothetical protein
MFERDRKYLLDGLKLWMCIQTGEVINMAMAYTPGLRRMEFDIIRKTRRLPASGKVLVQVGEAVTPSHIVARTAIPGDPQIINMCLKLDSEPEMVGRCLLKKEGEFIKKGETLAFKKGFLGSKFGQKTYTSEYNGTIEYVSDVSGQVIIRAPPVPVEVEAYVSGTIVEVIPQEGAIIECPCAFIQGIFGIGGETRGKLKMACDSPYTSLEASMIDDDCSGTVLVGGALVTGEALRKAVAVGVRGIIVGGIDNKDLSDFLGYEIGVAITGHETLGLTLIMIEGFGTMNLSEKTFQLFKKYEGRLVCINGATQIRAGVMRPEIIIPQDQGDDKQVQSQEQDSLTEGMVPGTPIRVIGDLYFGSFGHVVSLPVELHKVETGSFVRVLEAELDDGRRIIIPRANAEIIEE